MKKRFYSLLAVSLVLAITLVACGSKPGTLPASQPSSDTNTPQAAEPGTPSVDGNATPVMGVSVSEVGERGSIVSQISDVDTRGTGPAGYATGGDDPQNGRFERPFNPFMGYLNPIDILSATLSTGSSYFFIDIQTAGSNPISGAMDARYAVELDTELDGRGNYLIWIVPPYNTGWSTLPVMIFQDTNYDVGGPTPLVADPGGIGDGYDQLLFDGISTESEPVTLARLNPDDPSMVQIAFQPSFFNNPAYFTWWAWADGGTVCPQCIDYNDYYDITTAGSSLQESPNYPIISPYALDNTCRAAYGFDPTGRELGLCSGSVSQTTNTIITPQPGGEQPGGGTGGEPGGNSSGDENMPASATITGYTYIDTNRNGNWDNGEPTTNLYPVGLYDPDCSTLQWSGPTASNGSFTFSGIIGGGDFCVHPDTAGIFWSPSFANLSLAPGGYAVVLFGLQTGAEGGQGDTGGETGGGGVPPAQGRISGFTVIDNDGDGAEASDTPTYAYPVLLLEATCVTALATMTPRTDGTYEFEGLPPGSYCVAITPAALPPQVVTVPEGGNVRVTFGLPAAAPPPPPEPPPPPATGTITGTAFHDIDGDIHLSAGEPGTSGVTVFLYASGCSTVIATTTTNSAGSFTFGGVPLEATYCIGVDSIWGLEGNPNSFNFSAISTGSSTMYFELALSR